MFPGQASGSENLAKNGPPSRIEAFSPKYRMQGASVYTDLLISLSEQNKALIRNCGRNLGPADFAGNDTSFVAAGAADTSPRQLA